MSSIGKSDTYALSDRRFRCAPSRLLSWPPARGPGSSACGGRASRRSPCSASAPSPTRTSPASGRSSSPSPTYLAETLGVPVEYVPLRDYPASVETFKRGDIHLAWFGGLTGVQARHLVAGRPRDRPGRGGSRVLLVLHRARDTGLERVGRLPDGHRGPDLHLRLEVVHLGPPDARALHPREHAASARTSSSRASGSRATTTRPSSGWRAARPRSGAVNYKVYDARVEAGKTDPDVVQRDLEDAVLRRLQLHRAPRPRDDLRRGLHREAAAGAPRHGGREPARRPSSARGFIPATDEEFDGHRGRRRGARLPRRVR